jgi:hypothetical protein
MNHFNQLAEYKKLRGIYCGDVPNIIRYEYFDSSDTDTTSTINEHGKEFIKFPLCSLIVSVSVRCSVSSTVEHRARRVQNFVLVRSGCWCGSSPGLKKAYSVESGSENSWIRRTLGMYALRRKTLRGKYYLRKNKLYISMKCKHYMYLFIDKTF